MTEMISAKLQSTVKLSNFFMFYFHLSTFSDLDEVPNMQEEPAYPDIIGAAKINMYSWQVPNIIHASVPLHPYI